MLLFGIVEAVKDHHLIFTQKAKTEIAIGPVVNEDKSEIVLRLREIMPLDKWYGVLVNLASCVLRS